MDDLTPAAEDAGRLAPAAGLQPLVDAADVPALLRAVDAGCASRAWDQLVDLARRCREAIELGKQLWPVAMHIEYRLAHEAPGPYAAGVLRPGAARFALGPLTEVAASTHTWDELAPHLDDPASAVAVASERTIRGEDLTGRQVPGDVELPLRLQPWEPAYALPVYRDREALFPAPAVAATATGDARPLQPAPPVDADPAVEALCAVVESWTTQSEGRVEARAVEGDAAGAVAHLASEAVLEPISGQDALAWLQWCGASGGAYGRRPGGAAGRFAAWWALAALAGLPWPDRAADNDDFAAELGEALCELRWYRWTASADGAATSDAAAGAGHTAGGWHLHLAVHDPVDGLAWAVRATDQRVDDPDTPAQA